MALRHFFPSWFWWPTGIQAVAGGALCFVPLFNLLGYEFSFAISLVAVPTGLGIGLSAGRRVAPADRALVAAWLGAAAHLLAPLLLISLNALRVRNCNFVDGIGFFLLLPLGSALYAATLGVGVAIILCRTHWRWQMIAAVLVTGAPLVHSLRHLYTEPQIFVFDHLWGFFAGSIYDEVIPLAGRLMAFRGGTLLAILSVAGLILAWEKRSDWGPTKLAVVGVLVLGASTAYQRMMGPRAGFALSRTDIEQALPVVEKRAQIIIHLPPGLTLEQRTAIADDHAFRVAQITNRLGVLLSTPIHSYVYPDPATKQRLMGGRATMIAKPWLREIHIHGLATPHPTLAHELVHAVAASLGDRLFGVSAEHGIWVNMGLVEGLAEALTPDRGVFDLDTHVRAMRELNMAPDVRTLMGPVGFWQASQRRAYVVAGSFVRFLLDAHGLAPFQKAYRDGRLDAAYGQSLDQLIQQWETHLNEQPLTIEQKQLAENLFSRPSIFARPCAHEIAKLQRQAREAPPERAVDLQRQICDHLRQAPTCQLDLALALRAAEDNEAFLELSSRLVQGTDLNESQKSQLWQELGVWWWAQGEQKRAGNAFGQAALLDANPSSQRLQWVRQWALEQPEPLQETLRRFLGVKLRPLPAVLFLERAVREDPADKTLPYLIARQVHRTGEWKLALEYIEQASGHPFPPIEAERQRLVADCHWQLGEWSAAEAAYQKYDAIAVTSGDRSRAQDWLERVRFQRAHAAPPPER